MAEQHPERIGIYPGTFDPIHNGHLDIITRGAKLVDRLIVGVAINIGKAPLFELEQRVALVRHECDAIARRNGTVVEVRSFQGLLTHFARDVGAKTILRGLRGACGCCRMQLRNVHTANEKNAAPAPRLVATSA